jgi:hypothetical protein
MTCGIFSLKSWIYRQNVTQLFFLVGGVSLLYIIMQKIQTFYMTMMPNITWYDILTYETKVIQYKRVFVHNDVSYFVERTVTLALLLFKRIHTLLIIIMFCARNTFFLLFEPRHDKTNIVRLRPAWIQTSLRICAVWSISMLFAISFSIPVVGLVSEQHGYW